MAHASTTKRGVNPRPRRSRDGRGGRRRNVLRALARAGLIPPLQRGVHKKTGAHWLIQPGRVGE